MNFAENSPKNGENCKNAETKVRFRNSVKTKTFFLTIFSKKGWTRYFLAGRIGYKKENQ